MLLRTPLVVLRPTVLVLNVLVGLVCTIRLLRAGIFSWRTFWPFAVTSCPAAFIGGSLTLAIMLDKILIGLVLFYGGVWLIVLKNKPEREKTGSVRVSSALPIGAAIGLVSGLCGIGGGILIGPILGLMKTTTSNESRGIASALVLANSIAGLIPRFSGLADMPESIVYWAPAALVGAWIGTELKEATRQIILAHTRLLSLVLFAAGFKIML